jgi:hypothetical protein
LSASLMPRSRFIADISDRKAAPKPSDGPKWSEEEIKAEWKKTKTGKRILANLPSTTKFKAYVAKAGDTTNARYSPSENTIYIPSHYTSKEASPTAAHEAVHADQHMNQKRPKSKMDLVEMEVEAKNSGLDVYEEMGKPPVPYSYADESEFRARDPEGYNEQVRRVYRKLYNIN